MLELEAVAPGLGHLALYLGLGRHQVRLGRHHGGLLDLDLNLVGFLVELDQQVPFLHAVVVIHQDLGHLARHARSDEGDVAVDVSVVGGNGVECRYQPRNDEIRCTRRDDYSSP